MSARTGRSRFLAVLIVLLFTLLVWQHKRLSLDLIRFPSAHVRLLSTHSSVITGNVDQSLPEPAVEEDKQERFDLGSTTPELPSEYRQHEEVPTFCSDRFGIPFLRHLNESATAYCASGSHVRATSFGIDTAGGRVDNFFVAGPVTFDNDSRVFSLPCQENVPGEFASLAKYWYETGPGNVFAEFVNLVESSAGTGSAQAEESSEWLLLVKREGPNNLWHSLMEMFAATMTLDVIAMARDPRDGSPLMKNESELSKARIVILDSHEEGPYWDLWSRFSPLPMVRVQDLRPEDVFGSRIIAPLAGAANPFWQGDWAVLPCTESALLDVFVRRIFERYNLLPSKRQTQEPTDPSSSTELSEPSEPSEPTSPTSPTEESTSPIRLTFIDRQRTRKLFDQEAHIEALRTHFSTTAIQIEIELIDFATLPLRQQIQKAHNTDILVGVHGAGLTHAMFMQPESAVVEIMPETLEHKGFRNLAKLRGLRYFGMHGAQGSHGGHVTETTQVKPGTQVSPSEKGGEGEEGKDGEQGVDNEQGESEESEDWHTASVTLDIESYIRLIEAAVAGVSNSGIRNEDVQ